MAHRIRQAWNTQPEERFEGPVEVDETYVGGKRRNLPKAKRAKLEGRGPIGKTAVVGVKDRKTNRVSPEVVEDTKADTLQGFIHDRTQPGAKVYTDDASPCQSLGNHETVKHSHMEYVRGPVHTNGVESFWSMLKRAHVGTFHRLSAQHLHRYVGEFAGRHNMRELDTLAQMGEIASRMVGTRLRYRELAG
jgi:transposase-like protein